MYTFDEITGNERIIKSMRSAIANKTASHAYIIEGGRGMGKKLLANTFAKSLLCGSGDSDACCECVSCRSYDSLNNPDVYFVRPEKTKSVGVNDVREQIKKTVDIIPYRSNYKIYIIENAGSMTEQAQNALLKTLEEPPAYAVFLLLAGNSAAFLPTILSRCVIYKIKPLPPALVEKHLTDKLSARFLSVYARGSIGAALELASSETFSELRKNVLDILRGLEDSDLIRVFAAARQLAEYNMQDVLDIAYMWYRDVAIYTLTNDKSLCLQSDLADDMAELPRHGDVPRIMANLELIWQTQRRLSQNANAQLAAEVLLLKLAAV